MSELTFQNRSVVPFDNSDGKIWFTTEALSELLGYANDKQINKIFQRHKDEFTDSMTTVSKVTVSNKNNGLEYVSKRLFSARGAHLIGMFSRTPVAKDLRVWLLDLADKETGVKIQSLSIDGLIDMTGQQIHDRIAVYDKKSFELRGQKGSGLMAQRKRDIKLVREATALAMKLTQMQIPDLGDFFDGELA